MIVGPIFTRELAIAPRRPRLFIYRGVYAALLLVLMATAWLVLAGTQVIRSVGDMARFGAILFQLLTGLQLALVIFFSALFAASSVAQEKDRRTLILLLMTRLTNSELVLGKLMASLLHVLVMIASGLPVLMMCVLFGGVDFGQVWRVLAVTVATALLAGSLGCTLGLWREKTFQTLALTSLAVVAWLVLAEAIHAGLLGPAPMGVGAERLAAVISPLRAGAAAADPFWFTTADHAWQHPAVPFVAVSVLLSGLMSGVAVARVRHWNPSRQVLDQGRQAAPLPSIWGAAEREAGAAERARQEHVDARRAAAARQVRPRPVWDHPVLWREVRTWAYGRKVLLIRAAYVLLFVAAIAVLPRTPTLTGSEVPQGWARVLPDAARPLAPLFLVGLAIINAQAVTSITNERDGRSLDLLLVTDLSPKEFLFGKLGGVLWVTKEMVILPPLAAAWLWRHGALGTESFLFLVGGLLVLTGFVTMLGLHCGMIYANSRTAISVSLGTVFFLFLGVVTCLLMMISFSGSFQVQLAPFLAFILGGGVGLFAALGSRNPSPAIFMACMLLPFATFHALVSFLLQHTLNVFLVTAVAYGFATAAMMVPAVAEFDFAMGRTGGGEP